MAFELREYEDKTCVFDGLIAYCCVFYMLFVGRDFRLLRESGAKTRVFDGPIAYDLFTGSVERNHNTSLLLTIMHLCLHHLCIMVRNRPT